MLSSKSPRGKLSIIIINFFSPAMEPSAKSLLSPCLLMRCIYNRCSHKTRKDKMCLIKPLGSRSCSCWWLWWGGGLNNDLKGPKRVRPGPLLFHSDQNTQILFFHKIFNFGSEYIFHVSLFGQYSTKAFSV